MPRNITGCQKRALSREHLSPRASTYHHSKGFSGMQLLIGWPCHKGPQKRPLQQGQRWAGGYPSRRGCARALPRKLAVTIIIHPSTKPPYRLLCRTGIGPADGRMRTRGPVYHASRRVTCFPGENAYRLLYELPIQKPQRRTINDSPPACSVTSCSVKVPLSLASASFLRAGRKQPPHSLSESSN